MDDNNIKPIAVSMEKELAFYKTECERLKVDCKNWKEKHQSIWNDASRMYEENEMLKRDVESLTRALRILIGGGGDA